MADPQLQLDDAFLADLRKAAEEARALSSDRWVSGEPREGMAQVYSPSLGACRMIVPIAGVAEEFGPYVAKVASPGVVIALLDRIEQLRRNPR